MINQIADISGIDFSLYNKSFVDNTINNRMIETRCNSIEEYLNILNKNSSETDKLKRALNNNFSEFFRNSISFAFFEHHILPSLEAVQSQKRNREIRIWSSACASGQEAYSIAMLCDEFSKKQNNTLRFRIFATDISDTEIENAKKGIYRENALNNVTFVRVKNYFTSKGDNYFVNSKLKDYVDFSVFDLLSKQYFCPPQSIFGSFDVIFCANLLFYYRPNIQKRILQKVHSCLANNGWLIVGEAEKELTEQKTGYISYYNIPVLQKPA